MHSEDSSELAPGRPSRPSLDLYIAKRKFQTGRVFATHVMEMLVKRLKLVPAGPIKSLAELNDAVDLPVRFGAEQVHGGVAIGALLFKAQKTGLWPQWEDLHDAYPHCRLALVFNTKSSGLWVMHNIIDLSMANLRLVACLYDRYPFIAQPFSDFCAKLRKE